MAGYSADPHAQVQVASVHMLVRREKPRAELVVVDESHHATASGHQKILNEYPDAHIIRLTIRRRGRNK